MKKMVSLLLLLFLSFILAGNAGAEPNNVPKDNNGLVKPVNNPEKLSVKQLNKRLLAMGYTENEIEGMSDFIKRQIVQVGGKKANMTAEPIEQYYTSLNGVKYKITDENKTEIENIKQKDRIELGIVKEEPTFSTFDFSNGASEDIWSATTYVTMTGQTSTEYEYTFFADWLWSEAPFAYHTDKIAVAWENDFTGISNTESSYAWALARYADGDRMISTGDQVLDLKSEIYGLISDIGLGTWSQQAGGISQTLAVNKNLSGTRSSLVTKYVHPWTAFDVSLNIGPGSISSEHFYGDEWTWRVNVTIGS